ncbi:MAG: ferrochelatase [Acidobacteria bacterium]|nr:ferrochelatase [Acidobacteriota bacterium]
MSSREGRDKVGVVLFQLGGPDNLEAVEPFLQNLFLDPDIIDFPFAKMARPPLARLMAAGRARKVQKSYAAIGGRSPIVEWTRRQAQALEEALRPTLEARTVIAMRYWPPLTAEAIEQLVPEPLREIVLLPLYPQYSKTTTGSSFKEWRRRVARSPLAKVPVKSIQEFHDHPGYLDALVGQINSTLERFADPRRVHLIFSAHGVPTAVIDSGDPYQTQTEATVQRVLERGQWPLASTLCYQSKVGSGRWIGPSIHEVVPRLAAQGIRDVLVVPISFVSDHIETLYEIDREVREEAQGAGLRQFEMMPGLNDSPRFIRALADLVCQAVAAEVSS